jgi:aspartyl-tRNA(Asn)/glutamyl-tRNA(Gln) amidotransferase subunit B
MCFKALPPSLRIGLGAKAVRRAGVRPRSRHLGGTKKTRMTGDSDPGDWELVIGMEVHAQVTSSKPSSFPVPRPNSGPRSQFQRRLVDAAMPGMLPVINELRAQAVRTGLGLKAEINRSAFDRKNYFYPDLPQGYQISQFKHPDRGRGRSALDMVPTDGQGADRRHRAAAPGTGRGQVDPRPAPDHVLRRPQPLRRRADGDRLQARHALGRRGQGLCHQAAHHPALSRHLRRQHGEGSCAPTSTSPCAYEKYRAAIFGTRCEIKNVNSIRFIGQAIEYEARRQIAISKTAARWIDQETRLFDPNKGETRSMRSKEEAHDYRYFPDPDLLPLEIEQAWVDEIAGRPAGTAGRQEGALHGDYGLTPYDARVLSPKRRLPPTIFEEVAGPRRQDWPPTG